MVDQLYDGMAVMVPLETSNPHPFISLLTPTKGKRFMPRISRHLTSAQMMTMLTLLVACFSQLDVVRLAPILDNIEDTPEREEVEKQTNAFLESVLHSVLPTVLRANLRLITGLIGLLTDRSNIITVVQSKVKGFFLNFCV
jgi:DNA topoisomerase 2-associated protein PAT1